jgi:hypothetical protein
VPALARREVVLSTPVGNAVGRIFGCRSIIGRCDHDRKELSSLLVGYSPSTTAPDRNDALARPSATSPPIATPDGKEHSHPPGRCPQFEPHSCIPDATTSPRRSGPPPKDSPLSTCLVGGKTEALPGRPEGSGLVHCVCERDRTVKARGPHVSPSAAPTLTFLGKSVGRFFLAGDVHTMSTPMSTRSRGTCCELQCPLRRGVLA